MAEKIAILGAGGGGCSAVAEMTLKSFDVTLFEFPRFKENLEPIKKNGGITIYGPGAPVGFAKITEEKLTTDIKQAVKGVDYIQISVVCEGQRQIAELCAPHLEDGQIVFFNSAPGGALELAKVMKENRLEKDIVVGEANTMTYGAEKLGPETVRVLVKKGGVFAAAFPAKNTPKLMEAVNEFHPQVKPATNVFETALLDFNSLDHVPPGLLNVGALEGTTRAFAYWTDGVTSSVARCIEGVDNETLAIRKALGFKEIRQHKDWIFEQGFIDTLKPTVYEALHESPQFARIIYFGEPDFYSKCPELVETIPYGLRFISSIGDMVGVETPVIDALIALGSVICKRDFWKEGRTTEKLGIPKGLTVEELNKFLYEGKI